MPEVIRWRVGELRPRICCIVEFQETKVNTLTPIATAAALSTSLCTGAAFGGALDAITIETPVVGMPPVIVTQDWTGAYAGLNFGYVEVDGVGAAGGNDDTLGGYAGYDFDLGHYVVGGALEYDVYDTDLGTGVNVDTIRRLKLRGGYDFGRTLFYATAGLAQIESSTGSDTGEFVGLGITYKMTDRFDVGGELLDHRFDDIGGTGMDTDVSTFNLRGSLRF